MKKLIYLSIFLGIFLLALTSVQAIIQIEITTKPIFYLGDNVEFNYTLFSDTNQLVRYTASVDCPNSPQALLDLKTIQLQTNQKIYKNYSYLQADNSIEPQTCTALVSILEPYHLSMSKQFIIATLPSFTLNVYSCKDKYCNEKSRIFQKGENIYLDYSSSLENPSLTTSLIYPDKTTKKIELPISLKANQIGTYKIETSASKAGYKTISKQEQFAVIESNAIISSEEVLTRDNNSTINNPVKTALSTGFWKMFLIILIALIIVIIIFIIFFKNKQ